MNVGTDSANTEGAHGVPPLLEALEGIQTESRAGAWFMELRQRACERLKDLPLPSDTDEEWRYTKPEQFDLLSLKTSRGDELACSSLPPGVTLSCGDEISASDRAVIWSALDIDKESSSVSLLQLACVGTVAVLRVGPDIVVDQPIAISRQFSGDGALSSLLFIIVERGAKASFVEDLGHELPDHLFPRVEILVRDNASASFCSLQALRGTARALMRHRVHLQRDARAHLVHMNTGAAVARTDLDCLLDEPGASAELFSVSLADSTRHIDLHANQLHNAPHCRSELYSKSAVKDTARSVYYGYIKVQEGAQKTDAYQTSRNLVLSKTGRADAIPNLEIKANDVKCSHGASVGHVSGEELFYLRSRGLPLEAAEELLVEGFFSDLISRIQVPGVADRVYSYVMDRLRYGERGSDA
jgi:Fe-S cluster assembly protein SufD